MSRLRVTVAAIAAASLLGPLPAAALEARASGNTTVRTGPGDVFPVVARLIDGEYYEVFECTRRKIWCLVGDDYGPLGWVRGSQIVGEAAKNRMAPFDYLVNPPFFVRPRP